MQYVIELQSVQSKSNHLTLQKKSKLGTFKVSQLTNKASALDNQLLHFFKNFIWEYSLLAPNLQPSNDN